MSNTSTPDNHGGEQSAPILQMSVDEAMKQFVALNSNASKSKRGGGKRKRASRVSKSRKRRTNGDSSVAASDAVSETASDASDDSVNPIHDLAETASLKFVEAWKDDDDALQIPEARKEAVEASVDLAQFDTFVKRCFQQTDAIELMTVFCTERGENFVRDDDGSWYYYNTSAGVWKRGVSNSGCMNTALVCLRNQFTDWGIKILSDTLEEYRVLEDAALRSLESDVFTTGLKRLSRKLNDFRNFKFGTKWSDLVTRAQDALAQSDFRSRLDADPMIRCFKNCILDFRAGAVHEHHPRFLCSLQANHDYVSALDVAHSPERKKIHKDWQTHLRCVLANPAARAFHTDYQSYCMTGLNTVPWTMVCISTKHATNNNGKSATMEVLEQFNGTYAVSIRASALIEQKGPTQGNAHTAEIANVVDGPRIAFYSEVPDNATMNTMRFKQLTDKTMVVRRMYSGDEKGFCRAKLQGYVNMPLNFDRSKPEISDPIDKRLSGCNFETRFFETEEEVQLARKSGFEHSHLVDEELMQSFATQEALDVIGSFYCHNLLVMLDDAQREQLVRPLDHAGSRPDHDGNQHGGDQHDVDQHDGDQHDGDQGDQGDKQEAKRDPSTLLRGYMNRKHGAFRKTWLQGYWARIDFFEGFKLQLKFADTPEEKARVPCSEDVIVRALAIMKQSVDYVPQSADWEKMLRTRVINHWKRLHRKERVDDLCKRNQGKRVLLLLPEPGSDFAEAYTQAMEEIEAETSAMRQPRVTVFNNGRWAGST